MYLICVGTEPQEFPTYEYRLKDIKHATIEHLLEVFENDPEGL
jgi:hypothetical protein